MTFFINNFIINYRIFNQKKLIKLTNLQRDKLLLQKIILPIFIFSTSFNIIQIGHYLYFIKNHGHATK